MHYLYSSSCIVFLNDYNNLYKILKADNLAAGVIMAVKIHINKNLAKYASINPTKESRQVNIFDLCKGI